MTSKVIFVAGVHGVGKGTICQEVSSHFTYPHYPASSLIKSVKNAEVDKNKIVVDADKNQDYLITALDQLEVDSDYILVDGHFCLQGGSGVIEVPLETFRGMSIAATLLLTGRPTEIYKRLYSRDGTSLNVDVIQSLQNAERDRANYVANNLQVPFLEAQICDIKQILSWLETVIQ